VLAIVPGEFLFDKRFAVCDKTSALFWLQTGDAKMLVVLMIFVLATGFAFASFLSLCTFPAVWLAFGRTHLFLRMPIFLLCTLTLGIVPVLVYSPNSSDAGSAFVLSAILIAVSFVRIHLLVQVPIFLIGTATLIAIPFNVDLSSLDSSWIIRVAMAMTLIALPLALARLSGLRLVDLTDGVPGLDMEKGTGKELRQWFAFLDTEHAESLKHAEIMAILRQFGFSFAWQKTIAVAYERALGRWDIEPVPQEKARIVAPSRGTSIAELLTKSTNQQFSIWQLMLLTFCAACVFGFVRNFSWTAPTALDFKYVIPATIGVGVNTVIGLYVGLSLRRDRGDILAATAIAVVNAAGVSLLMGYSAVSPFASVAFVTILLHAFLVTAILSNLGYHGYRLVFVQVGKKRP